MHLIGSCLVDPAQFQTSSFAFDVRRWVGILPRLRERCFHKSDPNSRNFQCFIVVFSILRCLCFVVLFSVYAKIVIMALLPRKTFTGKHAANHILMIA